MTVGISVGITTPEVELNQLMMPAVSPMTPGAVTGLISLARPLASRSIPPSWITRAISMLIPLIINRVPQGMEATDFFSSATRNSSSTKAMV